MRTRDEHLSRPAQQQSRPSRLYLVREQQGVLKRCPIAGRTKELSVNAARVSLHRCASTSDTTLTHGRCNCAAQQPTRTPSPRAVSLGICSA
jgi:hypothetical protein